MDKKCHHLIIDKEFKALHWKKRSRTIIIELCQ